MKKTLSLNLLVFTFLCLFPLLSLTQTTTLHGIISYHNDGIRILPGVNVMLYESGELIATTLTDENGYYEFHDLPYGTYTLTGACDLVPGGISAESAMRILKHISGQQPLSPIELLAADVNGDGNVNGADFAFILVNYLIHGNPFPVGDWVFETITFELDGMKSSNSEKGLGGTSTGDTGGVFEPGILNTPDNIYTFPENIFSQAGEEVILKIRLLDYNYLSGMFLNINYPGELLEIIDIESRFGFTEYLIKDDQIKLSAVNTEGHALTFDNHDEIISIRARINENFANDNVIVLGLNAGSHFIGKDYEKISPHISLPQISANEEKSALIANYPNPFSIQTYIDYKIAEPTFVNLHVYSLEGRLISAIVNDFQGEGRYRVNFGSANLAPGAYIICLRTSGNNPVKDTRVMIITSE